MRFRWPANLGAVFRCFGRRLALERDLVGVEVHLALFALVEAKRAAVRLGAGEGC